MIERCVWLGNDELMIKYHDEEWGNPVHDDTKLFEYIILDAFQAGLSWRTVLNKRENFRIAFDDYNYLKIAQYDDNKVSELLSNPGIIRNRQKINAAIVNAQMLIKIKDEFGSFDKFIWQFTDYKTIHNSWTDIKQIPPKTAISDTMSRELVNRGFKFVGSTICYSFMQAAGMVNDHTVNCFRYKQLMSK